LSQPLNDGRDCDDGEVVGCGLFEPCCDASELLEPAEAAFDEMTLGIEVLVDRVLLRTRWIVRDDGDRPLRGNGLTEVIGIVGRVGHDDLSGKALDQRSGLRDVAAVACGEAQSDRTPQAPDGETGLGAQAAARAADCLIFRPPSRSRRMLMSANDGGVDDQVFEVGIVRHRLEDAPPDVPAAPSAGPTEDTVALSEGLGQIALRRAGANDPKHNSDEHPIVPPRRASLVGPTDDQRRHPLPSRVRQHQTILYTQDQLPKAQLLIKRHPTEPSLVGPPSTGSRRLVVEIALR
jgi:hypothetical protein